MALAGNPNAGKTTLFNTLTGSRQHVGNYPGITVDYKEGAFHHAGCEILLTDLPGTYSLTAYSVEELVARDYLVNEKPQVVINIVDASNLERNLYLTCQFLELGVPLIIALNMIDVAKDRGIEVRAERLSALLGVPVVPIIARTGQGKNQLMEQAIITARDVQRWHPLDISYGDDLDETIMDLVTEMDRERFLVDVYPARFTAIKYLENDDQIIDRGRKTAPDIAERVESLVSQVSDHLVKTMDVYPEAIIADHRYGFIKSIIRQGVLTHKFDTSRLYTSDKIDKVVTNRLLGPVIMLAVLFGVYKFTFSWSELPVTWLDNAFSLLGKVIDANMHDGLVKSMLTSGIIHGVGGVLGFVPLIMFMFFAIAILEDSGYLARVAFMMDRVFRIFGLHGSSVMPFIISGGIAGGCAVPGVLATRTLRSPKERLATLLTVPFMNCGAKLPVLALLIGTFFQQHQAKYMFFFTMLSWVVALLSAKLFRSTVLKGESTPFVMELPPYRFPTPRGLIIHTWERTWQYIKKAGTVILGISILIWAMMTFPSLPANRVTVYNHQRETVRARFHEDPASGRQQPNDTEIQKNEKLTRQIEAIDNKQAEEALRNSAAGKLGMALEAVSHYAGFDWRTNIALIGGFAAKEVIVSTLGTAYSMGQVDTEKPTPLGRRLQQDPHWSKGVAIAALLFIMFYSPCFVTIVCIAREASWKWAFFSMTFNTVFAFFLAVVFFQISRLSGLI